MILKVRDEQDFNLTMKQNIDCEKGFIELLVTAWDKVPTRQRRESSPLRSSAMLSTITARRKWRCSTKRRHPSRKESSA